jgi:hypothetical protein
MADLSITPVAGQIKPVQGASLADMMNIARGAQAYQQAAQINPLALQQQQQATRTGEIALGVEEQKNKERNNMQTFFSDPNNFQTDGRIDLDKINKLVPAIAPLTGADYITKFTTLGNAQTTAEKATLELGQADRELIAQPISILGRAGVTDPKAYAKVIKETIEQNKKNPRLAALGNSYLTQLEFADPSKLPDIAIRASQNLLSPAQAQTALAQQVGTVNTGEKIFPTVTTPAVGGNLPRIQMGAQPLADIGLPPTTEVIDPATGQKRLLGPASQRGGAPLTTGLGPAQTSLLTAGGATIGTDLQTTVKEGGEAPGRIAIFQNIKKFAPDSFTGVGGQRKELAAGILNAIGIPAYEQEKVNTEELAKNSALLALAGGNTDAARALAEVATPNKKLNEKAILAIADQMIGIENMKVAKANYLTPVQNDATQYGQRQLQFNQIADPRIFQEMTAQDVAKLKASMSPAEQAELTRKIRLARQMGIIR